MASHTSKPRSPKKYLRCSAKSVPCVQALGYTVGKTLGSGAFAKVKAAWSPFEHQMVRILIVCVYKFSFEVTYLLGRHQDCR